MASQQQRFLPAPFFISLLGILFSLWNLWGDPSALCVTEGCALFQDFTIAGVSLWWGGLAGFSLLLLTSIPGFSRAGLLFAGIGLVLDSLLLVIMLVTAPCFNCLIIGLLLALAFMAFRSAWREDQRVRGKASLSPVLALWVFLFVLNAGCLFHSLSGPWALRGGYVSGEAREEALWPGEAPVQVYFSPSCAACRTLVRNEGALAAAWYPVAENPRDVWVIADMERRMREGVNFIAAMEAALAAAPETPAPQELATPRMLWMQFCLWRNRAHVLNAGSSRLPYVEFRGIPAGMLPEESAAVLPGGSAGAPATPAAGGTSGALPFLSVGGACEEGHTEPCDDPQGGVGGSLSRAMEGRP